MNRVEYLGKLALKRTHHAGPIRAVAKRLAPEKYDVTIGTGVSIGGEVDLRGSIHLGDHTTVNDGASLYRRVELDDHAKVGQDALVRGPASVGPHTNILQEVRIRADVDIGGYTAIAHSASIQSYGLELGRAASQQDFQTYLGNQNPSRKRPIKIGNDCYISRDAVIAPGTTIGDGAVVGAGAVVANDVDSYTAVAGNPAKEVNRRLPEETARRLLDIKWWEWPDQVLQSNAELLAHIFNREQIAEEDKTILDRMAAVSAEMD